MVIEHVFITTLEATETLRLAADFLSANGFRTTLDSAFDMSNGMNTLDMTRGRTNAARAKSIDQLPQRVRMEWDRGRVTVAASILAAPKTGFLLSSSIEARPGSPKIRLHGELMAAIAQGLELLLVHAKPYDEAMGPIDRVMIAIGDDARRQRNRAYTIIVILVAFFTFLIALAIYAGSRR